MGSKGVRQGATQMHAPIPSQGAYHALVLVQATKPTATTTAHRAAATWWEGQWGRAPT